LGIYGWLNWFLLMGQFSNYNQITVYVFWTLVLIRTLILIQTLTYKKKRKQPIVTLSSSLVEYVVVTITTCQSIWLRRMLKDFLQEKQEPTTVFCDNNFAIMLSKNHVFRKKIKHIDTRYHFIKELVNKKKFSWNFADLKKKL